MKILIHSNVPWAGSGYGAQTALFAHRFRDAGHDVAISANWGLQGGCLNWDGFGVYPSDNAWGNRTLPVVAAHHAGDPTKCLVITLIDVFTMNQPRLADLRMACWTPVDHHPTPPRVVEFFHRTGATPIAMSRFGERELAKAGLAPAYVPHGIDTNVFRPLDGRDEIRKMMRIPADVFVVGMVARNQGKQPPRKAFPQVFVAFSRFLKQHSDAVLYLHADMIGFEEGMNLFALAEACGIPMKNLVWSPQNHLEFGLYGSEDMAQVYAAFDVLANPSLGEGFGIPIVEAQACGVPVIVTDHTAMPELCGAGWMVDGDLYYDPAHGAFWKIPAVGELEEAFEAAYIDVGRLTDKAREFAVRYDADLVMKKYWTPVLAELEEQMAGPREVAPLQAVAG